MKGTPGDFTPPSRFVRTAAFVSTVHPIETHINGVNEAFRILSNFDIPLGFVTALGHIPLGVVRSTQFTTVSDLTNKNYYYVTEYNRKIRQINLNAIDFCKVKYQCQPLDKIKGQDIEVINIR